MEVPEAVSGHEEEPASGIWDWGMAERLEDTADSGARGDEQEEEKPGTSEGPEKQSNNWLDDNGKQETQLQPRGSEGQPEAKGGEEEHLQPRSGDEKELPTLQGRQERGATEVGKATLEEAASPLLMDCTGWWLFIPVNGAEWC